MSKGPRPHGWKRIARIGAIVVGGLVVLIIAAGAAIFIYIGSSGFRGEVEKRAGVALGREIKIGELTINWSWTPMVRLREVVLGAAAKDAPPVLDAKLLEFRVRLLPLLAGNVVLPNLRLEQPKLALERDAKGVPNWSFQKNPATKVAAEVAAPEERSEAPIIGELVIKDGHFTYEDEGRDLKLEGEISTAIGEAGKGEGVQLSAKGTLQGKPLTVRFSGGSILSLRDTDQPYSLDFAAQYGETEMSAQGEVDDPFKMEAADIQLSLKGPDLSEVFPLLGVPAPPTPPYDIKGHLLHEGEKWQFTGFEGRVGDSDMSGDIAIDYGREKPVLTADLRSNSLDFDDLAPLVGAPPDSDETASAEQKKTAQQLKKQDTLFPDVPLKVDLLDVMDMKVSLDARKVTAENYLPVQSLDGTVTIEGGKAVVDPLKIGVANGTVEGTLSLDSNEDPAAAAADLKVSEADLQLFFRGTGFVDTTGGKISADIDIQGTGASLADVMGTASGKTFIAMNGGSISGLLVEAAGLDIAEALALYITEDAKIPIRCGAGHIELSKGNATFDRMIVDTTDSVLYFRGETDLGKQTLKMDIFADAKDFSVLDIDAPVHLQGKIRDPQISIGKGVPIPLIEPGDAKDVSCELLLRGSL
jgi:AsmA family protein